MQANKLKLTALLLSSAILVSCATHPPQSPPPSLAATAINEAIAVNQKAAVVLDNQAILDSMLPKPSLVQHKVPEERFDLDAKDLSAQSFLLSLVDGTPFNMVVSPEVNLKISLQLKNVTISEVLAALERVYPLTVERQGDLFFVSSAESFTQVYPVDYLNLSRHGKSQTRVAGQATSTGQNNSSNQSSSSNNSNQSGGSVSQTNASEIITENKADFWSELQTSLEMIVRAEEKAQVVVSPQAGIVVVKALPRTQRLIQEYLNVTQNTINRQVILEAKIIEVSLNEGFQAGIDWRKIYSLNSGDGLLLGQQGQVLELAESDSPMNGIFSMLYKSTSFEGAINLLKTQGDVQVLSSPRISTVNNQKAVIKVGSDEFFVTDISTTTVTGTSTATSPDVTLTPFFSGISLDVTPQINSQGKIILHIHPIVSEVDDQQKTLTLGNDEFTLPLALSNVRESDSIVRTEDQQVVVIGGLMQNRVQKQDSSTPLMSDLPLVGKLFDQKRDSMVKSELVILLKANLVNQSTSENDLNQIKSRLGL